ncbi:cell division regulator GpsB [Chryseomicrobium sp. FSL W7-1435]|uniref:cell division regulator GpsB n=1 Tax=Chryseomicrobium sp. FSL W7-1435 TaxID=2921704 RepID=UPI00315A5AAB
MAIQFKTSDILEKQFKTTMRGYSQEEVDAFLDEIIKDYEQFDKRIQELEKDNRDLRTQIEDAPRATPAPQTSTNFDILKRLSNLEKHVFGDKLYD